MVSAVEFALRFIGNLLDQNSHLMEKAWPTAKYWLLMRGAVRYAAI